MYRVMTMTEPQGNRCNVTIEEVDVQSNPTGREYTEPFDTKNKDWAGLKERFKKRIAADDAKTTVITELIDEANDAKLTTFP